MIKREFQFLESLILLQLALIGNLFYRFNTDNWKISGFRERKKKKKVKNQFAMQDKKDILKFTSIISSLSAQKIIYF